MAEPFRCLSLDPKISLLVKVYDMGVVAFDTHKVVKDLKRAGFNDQQAEAVVSAVGEAVGENVATKADLEPVAKKADIQASLEPYMTKADLQAALEPYMTKADLQAALEPYVTKADLRATLEPYATKADLRTTLEPYATKADLQETKAELYRAIWIQTGAIIAAVAALLRLFR